MAPPFVREADDTVLRDIRDGSVQIGAFREEQGDFGTVGVHRHLFPEQPCGIKTGSEEGKIEILSEIRENPFQIVFEGFPYRSVFVFPKYFLQFGVEIRDQMQFVPELVFCVAVTQILVHEAAARQSRCPAEKDEESSEHRMDHR